MTPVAAPLERKDAGSERFQEALRIASGRAEDVDRAARFPAESMEALRAAGALGWHVPARYGGAGLQIEELAGATFELARRCASTGLIFAMHQIQVAIIVQHHSESSWFEDYLRRLVRNQRLIASATSEVGVGGDLRRSIAALEPVADAPADSLTFQKNASTISYGAQADDLLTTVRRAPDADQGDQVIVLTPLSEMQVTQTGEWDTLGMRGTCSPGFNIRAKCRAHQVLPAPFATIAAETMVPVSHILWAHVWLGLSAEAFDRAQNFIRAQARQNPGVPPPAAIRLAELSVRLAEFRALVAAATSEYAEIVRAGDCARLSTMGYALRINNLKIAASEAAVEVCQGALRICGFAGYKNSGPYSTGRHLRDAYSAGLMIANDRLRATNASLLLVHRGER